MATSTSTSPQMLTDADIIRLAQNPQSPLTYAPLLSSTPDSTLLSYLSLSSSPSLYLSSLLSLFSQTTPPNPTLLSSLLLSFLRLFLSRQIPRDRHSSAAFRLLSLRLPDLPAPTLTSLSDLILSDLPTIADPDDAQPLDLLPPSLALLAGSESGGDLVDSALRQVLAADWSKVLLVKIVSLLREFRSLDKDLTREFLHKIFDGMTAVDLQDLPSIVYQLLLSASKGFGRRAVVEGIVGFFGRKERVRSAAAIVRQVEGTVLLHVNFAVKQDPSLGQEVLGLVRSDLGTFNCFTVVVLLSIARVRRFAESAIGVLKNAVVAAYRDHRFARDCKWLPDNLKGECLRTVKRVEKGVIQAVNESNYGREHIVPSIVQFGFALLESVEGSNSEELSDSDGLMGVGQLGIEILKTLFEVHEMARNEIIEQGKFRILSLKPQQSMPIIKLIGYLVRSYPFAMLEHVSRLKELLDYFTFMHDEIATHLVTSLLPFIKFSRDLQDYIILVVRKAMFRREDTVRIAATNAIIDLIVAEKRSKNNGPDSLQESSSQASCSQQAEIPRGMGISLFQELSGLLRRCLSQKATVKEIIYRGLVKLVALDPFIADCGDSEEEESGKEEESELLMRLQDHLSEEVRLSICSCVKIEGGKACLEEPLDCLLSCVSWILLLQPHGKPDHLSESSWAFLGFSLSQDNESRKVSSGESFANALSNIRKFLRDGSLEDVIAKCQDPGSRSFEGEKSSYCVWILSGIVEVLLNVVATELEKATDMGKLDLEKELMQLVDLYDSLQKDANGTKQINGPTKGSSKSTSQGILDKSDHNVKGGSRAAPLKLSQARRSFLATSSIHQVFVIALKLFNVAGSYAHVSQNHSQSSPSTTSVNCSKLISFGLKACLHHLKSFSAIEKDDPLNTLIYGDMCVLGCPLLQLGLLLLKSCSKLGKDQKKKEVKGRKVIEERAEQIHLSLTCLYELIKINFHSPQFTDLIEDLASVSATENVTENGVDAVEFNDSELASMVDDQHMRNMHLFLDKIIKPFFSELLALSLFRESEVLSEIVLMIGNKLPCKLRDSLGGWAVRICSSSEAANAKAARSILALAVYLRSPPNDLVVAQDMASELLTVFGSEERDPVEKSESYPIINHSTEPAIASLLLQFIESIIADLDWAISKSKALSATSHEITDIGNSDDHGAKAPGLVLEEALYSRSEALVNLFSSFAEMSLKDPQSEQLLTLAAKVYKHLVRMTKLRIAPKGCRQLLPGLKFQRLAEVTCKKLTCPLYKFVALMQKNQQENVRGKGIMRKIRRENRCIPDLIFQIEDYEKYLIQLSKLTKVNLLRHAKRSTARDFKILDVKMTAKQEEEPEHESSPVNSNASRIEPGEESECEEENGPGGNVSAGLGSAAVEEDSGCDSEEQGMVIKTKRAKLSKVVQDSDEET